MTSEDLKAGWSVRYWDWRTETEEGFVVSMDVGERDDLVFADDFESEFAGHWVDHILARGAEVRDSDGVKIWPDPAGLPLLGTNWAPRSQESPRP